MTAGQADRAGGRRRGRRNRGSQTAARRANPIWERIVADFEPPGLDGSIRAELDDFVQRRTAEGGAMSPS